ncbi:hypothetical protein jhhlp_004263 [Lomentospora prolificans]|uniref:Acetoacetate decarboxylase n=1 Tax=Lomentospora prolificans TaxID=41688 RepID=A0A2N3NB39_9PEZI|nr:hypothetical protein jhhlp_004263 [Lomentospora prolificans]
MPNIPAPDDITHVPAPWTLKGTVYQFAWWTPRAQAEAMPTMAYSPLESSSSFSAPEGSKPLGGLSVVQIIRYTDSPVGPYDELLVIPGFHEYAIDDEKTGKRVTKRNARITRIYVSQKYTCWNGRINWNIPKHLASFEWHTDPSTSTTMVKVYPHDMAVPAGNTRSIDASEATASKIPFFQATFKPIPFTPNFPFSARIFNYLGVDPTLVQPPLPEGNNASKKELPGTNRWCAIDPVQSSWKTRLGWFDLRQETDASGNVAGGAQGENFWPGIGRWHLGIRMEDATIEFGEGRYWDSPRSVL